MKTFGAKEIIELFNKLEREIKDLWCFVEKCCKKTIVNIGSGAKIFKKYSNGFWQLRTLKAGTNITITEGNDEITINATSEPFDCEDLNNCSTDNLPEGVTNLYFTNSRAITALTGQNISIFNNNVGYITCSDVNGCVTGSPFHIPFYNSPGGVLTSDGSMVRKTVTKTIDLIADPSNFDCGYIDLNAIGSSIGNLDAGGLPLAYFFSLNTPQVGWNINSNNFVLPSTDGNAGDVMTTDGSGNITFQPVSGGYITAIADTNTINLTETAGTLTADVIYQNTATINLSEDASGLKADLATGAAVANLGYTPENVANKATNFTTLNNTLYPTTQAVDAYIKETGYPVFFGKFENTAATNTEYVALSGLATAGTAANRASAICNDYTVARLTVYRDNAQPGTGSFEYTLFVNGVASALKVTVAAGSAAGSFTDTTNTVNVSSGDILVVEFKNNAATQSQTLGCSVEFRRR